MKYPRIYGNVGVEAGHLSWQLSQGASCSPFPRDRGGLPRCQRWKTGSPPPLCATAEDKFPTRQQACRLHGVPDVAPYARRYVCTSWAALPQSSCDACIWFQRCDPSSRSARRNPLFSFGRFLLPRYHSYLL